MVSVIPREIDGGTVAPFEALVEAAVELGPELATEAVAEANREGTAVGEGAPATSGTLPLSCST